MARLFVTSINLNKNELQNARIQNLSSEPSSPVLGQIYYNSSDNKMYYYNGLSSPNGPWVTMSGSDEVIQDVVAESIVASTGLTKTYDDTAGTITLAIDDTVVTKTDVQTLTNKTINDELYFTNPSTVPNDGGIKVNDSNEHLEIRAYTSDLDLYSNNGDITLNPDGITKVNSQLEVTGLLSADNSARVGVDLNVGGWSEASGTILVKDNNNNNKVFIDSSTNTFGTPALALNDDTVLKFVDNYNEIYTGNISIDQNNPGRLNINATGEIYLTTDGSQGTGNIVISPDNDTIVQGDLVVSNRIDAGSGINIGGADYQNNGFLNVKDYNGENLVNINTDGNVDGGTATLSVKGNIEVYGPGAFGNKVGHLHRDNDDNLVIDATQNNLILTSDSGNAYMNSVTSDNRIITIADLAAVSSGLAWKQAVNLLWDDSNAGLTGATGTLMIDGHAALDNVDGLGYRILITNGTNAGIWDYSDDGTNWTLTRSVDADAFAELKGAAVFVMEGTQYGSTSWVQSNHYLTDFTGQEWSQFSGQGTYVGSDSILIDGNQVSVILDSDSLEITSSGLKVNYHTESGLDNDSGMYVKLGTGLVFDGSGNITNDTSNGYGVRKFVSTIGDSSATSFSLTHGFGTRHVTVQVFQAGTPYAQVETDVERTDSNTVTVKFAAAPGTGEYEVVILG